MLFYRVGLPVSTTVHEMLAAALAQDRARRGVWRKLTPASQALLVLAHLHDNVTYTALARGFGIGVATVYRYVVEACTVLTSMAPTLDDALDQARSKAYLVLDGTVIETDRVRSKPRGADRGYYSGKTHRHGMNERWSSPMPSADSCGARPPFPVDGTTCAAPRLTGSRTR